MAFGKPLVPRHRLSAADVILSLDSDFLAEGAEQTRLSREFAARREPSPRMSRLYVVEPAVTVTGAMADHRLRMQGSEVGAFVAGPVLDAGQPRAGEARARWRRCPMASASGT